MDDFSKDLLPTMRSVRYMARHGASYDNAFVVDSLCCVSRASTFTGQYPHQTGVFTNGHNLPNDRGPMGGWRAFAENGGEGRTFALRLQESGYTTGYVGKYLNGYEAMRGHQVPPVPRGWSDFRAIFGTAYDQWKFHASIPDEHGVNELVEVPAPPASAPERVRDRAYAGEVIADHALDFLRTHRHDDEPYFIEVAPYGPHGRINDNTPYDDTLFPPAFRDRPGPGRPHGNCGLVDCQDLTVADLPGYGDFRYDNRPSHADGSRAAQWNAVPHELGVAEAETNLRDRARMAQSIDRMVMRILKLVDTESPGDTYVVLTSDNGFHLGQLGLKRGKGTAYDTDVNVPVLVVGPGVVPGSRNALISNLDWASTFEELAGIDSPAFRSGVSIVPTLRDPAAQLHDYVFFEHTFSRTQPGKDPDRAYTGGGLNAIPSYVAVRSRTALLVRSDLDRRWGHADYAYEFYDYRVQSSERIDQFNDGAYASEVATMMAKLQEFDACHHLQGSDPVTPECAALTRETPIG